MIERLSQNEHRWVHTGWNSFKEIVMGCTDEGVELHDDKYEYFIIEYAFKRELYRQKITVPRLIKLLKQFGIIELKNGKHCFVKCVEGEEITIELSKITEELNR